MAFRFRKSVKLAPGIRMNFSGSGLSWTVGPRGASIGIGKRGTYLNSGIPGTGFYSRTRLDGGGSGASRPSSRSSARETVQMSVSVSVSDEDGTITFNGPDGNPLSPAIIEQVKKQKGDAVRTLIAEACANVNAPIEALSRIHLDTPDPKAPRFIPAKFDEPEPAEPMPKPIGLWDRLLFRRARIEEENDTAAEQYRHDKSQWDALKAQFVNRESKRRTFIERLVLVDVNAMEMHLEHTLQDITWPRETLVSFDVHDGGKVVYLDVDLPELEDMPNRTAVVPAREWRLAVKPMAAGQIQKLYMAHVHGIGFRIVGEVFAALPTASKVVLSAFSQRASKATGAITDEYLYSVQVTRDQWQSINFKNLASIDVVESLSAFDLRRSMTKTGVFKAVEPFAMRSSIEGS